MPKYILNNVHVDAPDTDSAFQQFRERLGISPDNMYVSTVDGTDDDLTYTVAVVGVSDADTSDNAVVETPTDDAGTDATTTDTGDDATE